jgi:hypothetical protein
MMSGDNTPGKTALRPAWSRGQSGNPSGRPKGAKNKLSEQFLANLLADWEQNGPAAIARVREQSPAVYVRIVASLVPKQFMLRDERDPLEDLSEEELRERLAAVFEEMKDHLPLLATPQQRPI